MAQLPYVTDAPLPASGTLCHTSTPPLSTGPLPPECKRAVTRPVHKHNEPLWPAHLPPPLHSSPSSLLSSKSQIALKIIYLHCLHFSALHSLLNMFPKSHQPSGPSQVHALPTPSEGSILTLASLPLTHLVPALTSGAPFPLLACLTVPAPQVTITIDPIT